MHHSPQKRFGQNFLQDTNIIESLLSKINFAQNDTVVEIGPGLGALTTYLLKELNVLTAIEIDDNLISHLVAKYSPQKLKLIHKDALLVDYSQFGDRVRLIGNLAYNISSPLMFHLLNFFTSIKDMHFMLQKEVGLRLTATPGTKQYGRLSVIMQYFFDMDIILIVPPSAFYPQPKVDSVIIRFLPNILIEKNLNLQAFEKIVKLAFSMRRKTIFNNLKNHIDRDILIDLGINPQDRPENLSVKNYISLAKIYQEV